MLKCIPDFENPEEYRDLKIIGSKFVELVDGEEFDVKMQYSLMHLEAAETHCWVRKEVYERLILAQKSLPKGVSLRILDAWRPFKLQEELYQKYSQKIINVFSLKSQSEKEQKKVISRYISEPEEDRMCPPVHTTGGAVDLTLVDEQGNVLDMGTEFDSFSTEAHTCYYENSNNIEIKNNRRMLYNAMIKAGFTNLPSEWWHFDYGDRFWAFYNNRPAIYEGVFTAEEVEVNEG